jgi:hypothetical protein
LKEKKVIALSIILLVLTFSFIIKTTMFENGNKISNTLPIFETKKKEPVRIETEGLFEGAFGERFIDIEVEGKTTMFTYEENIKKEIGQLTEGDLIKFIYLLNVEEKEKKILTFELLKDKKEIKEVKKPEKEKEDEDKILTDLYPVLKINSDEKEKKVFFEIHNDSMVDKTLKFDTGQQYEIIIKDEDEKIVYTYSENYSFSKAETEIEIKADEKYVFETQIKALKKGKYTLEVWSLSTNTEEIKAIEEIEEKKGEEKKKEVTVNYKDGEKTVPAEEKTFDGNSKWMVLENTSFNGSNLSSKNYDSSISLAKESSVKEERWRVAEILQKEGEMKELVNKVASDEFVFYVEKSNGNIHEVAVKNINGTLYRFETVYTLAWNDSRNEIDAMVKTIQ